MKEAQLKLKDKGGKGGKDRTGQDKARYKDAVKKR